MVALASEDGSVTVKELVVKGVGDSFVFDDVSSQTITSENRNFVQHSEKALTCVLYVGHGHDAYCTVGGDTIY